MKNETQFFETYKWKLIGSSCKTVPNEVELIKLIRSSHKTGTN